MLFGQRFGDPLGSTRPSQFYLQGSSENAAEAVLSWEPSHESSVVHHLFFDGRLWQTLLEPIVVIPTQLAVRDHIEVLESSLRNSDEECSRFASMAMNSVRLRWNGVDGAAGYEAGRTNEAGLYPDEPIYRQAECGEAQYSYTDRGEDGLGLPDGAYYYRVVALDDAGNATASDEESVEIAAAPRPPADVAAQWNAETSMLTLSWTQSPDADVVSYAIYRNDGEGPIDISSVYGTSGTPSWSESLEGLSGRFEYLVRACDGTNEEANVAQLASIDLVNGVRVMRPNSPGGGTAVSLAGGGLRLSSHYNRSGEAGVATRINFYSNDGLGGEIDYVSPAATVGLSGMAEQTVCAEPTGLAEGRQYSFVARAETDAGVEDGSEAVFSGLTDGDGPPGVTLWAEVV